MEYSVLRDLYPEGVRFRHLDGTNVPAVYTDVEEEYRLIREHLALIDGIGFAVLAVSGEGACAFLDRLATKDIEYLNPGRISECLFLNEDAEAIGITYILNDEDRYLVMSPPENAGAVTEWMMSHKPDDADIRDLTEEDSLLFLEGQESWKLIRELHGFPIETLPLRDSVRIDVPGANVLMARFGRSGEFGYAFLGRHEVVRDLAALYLKSREKGEIGFCGTAALSVCMKEISQPVFGEKSAEKGNLFELGQQWFVQYDKEDYIGHDRLMELFEEPLTQVTVGFTADGRENVSGADVTLFGEKEGTVLESCYSPSLKGMIGSALLKKEVGVSGIPLSAETEQGEIRIRTLSSPYVRPASWNIQME